MRELAIFLRLRVGDGDAANQGEVMKNYRLPGMKIEATDQQAQCPECYQWSDLEIQGGAQGGYWWKNSAGCPKCGEISCVESECSFRRAKCAN